MTVTRLRACANPDCDRLVGGGHFCCTYCRELDDMPFSPTARRAGQDDKRHTDWCDERHRKRTGLDIGDTDPLWLDEDRG